MARELASYGWRSEGYHAGKLALERQRVQGDFMAGKLEVVVATVAFGLGVNKSDVRLVVHAGLPRSIEAWVQETGRAGRDGLPAQCVALVCEEDYRRLHSQCHRDGIGHEQLKRMLAQIMRGARNGYGELPHKQLETKLDMTREVAETILALLTDLPPSAWRAPQEEAEEEAGGEEGEGEEEEEQEALEKAKAAEAAACARAFAQDEEDARAAAEGPLIALARHPTRRAAFLPKDSPAEVVAERSPLVANLLKYAKLTGSYRCPLCSRPPSSPSTRTTRTRSSHSCTRAASCGFPSRTRPSTCVYAACRRARLDTLTAHLMRRVDGVEQLATTSSRHRPPCCGPRKAARPRRRRGRGAGRRRSRRSRPDRPCRNCWQPTFSMTWAVVMKRAWRPRDRLPPNRAPMRRWGRQQRRKPRQQRRQHCRQR